MKVGEVLDARVTFVREDGRLDASLREIKELAINSDAEIILKFMQEHGGNLNLHDKSDPAEIFNTFKISKAAFKRAIGHLLKERLIEKLDSGYKIGVRDFFPSL